jgi:anti-anti-sigma factor
MVNGQHPNRYGGDIGSGLAQIDLHEHDRVFSVAVRGELDISNVERLRVAAMMIPNEALGLVVDLTDTSFIDSSTVGLLFELKNSLARRSQALRVVCRPSSPPARALEMMSFDASHLAEDSELDAIASIRREVPLRA